MQYSTWQSAGKGLKLHRGFWGPGGTCFAQVLKLQYFDLARQGQGQRAMAKRWQGSKAARKGLGPSWNVLCAGFETL